ncbi:MAG: glycosyltransferase [Candidatus Dojkabacteria bacterium]|jgi:glycosyltransferase involved in cell wall biosynthesis
MSKKTPKKTPKESNLRVAISCEPLYKKGGAEVHLRHIINTFPNCELFTAYYDEEFVKEYFSDVKINHSFMQYLPKRDKLREVYLLLQPLAYGSFKFKGFDIVLSLSIAFSRFVKSKDIKHINLCMSPPKFLWQKSDRTLKSKEQLTGFKKFLFKIYSFFQDTFLEDIWKKWDRESAQRCTKIIANSKVVKKRIKKFYDMDSDVIYPPVDVSGIQSIKPVNRKENWFLYMGRVETYKGVKLAIDACVGLGYPLKIAGSGADLEAMREHVKKLNAKGLVKFLGFVSEEEKLDLLLKAKALIFPVRGEDFGIVPVEANAAGTPVIAYRDGGVTETISEKNPKTGVFFDEYNKKSLMKVMKNFNTEDYSQENCRKQAQNFASEIFEYKLLNYVKDALHSN